MPAHPAHVAVSATHACNFQTRRPHIQGILLCMFAREATRIWGSYFSFFIFSVYQKATPPLKGGGLYPGRLDFCLDEILVIRKWRQGLVGSLKDGLIQVGQGIEVIAVHPVLALDFLEGHLSLDTWCASC